MSGVNGIFEVYEQVQWGIQQQLPVHQDTKTIGLL